MTIKCENQGFSLIECVVAMLILAIIMSYGFYSYKDILMRNEREAFLNALKQTIAYGRSEAFFRNTNLTLCGSKDKTKCHLDTDWSTGFILFENPSKENNPEVIKILRVVPGVRYGKVTYVAGGYSSLLHIPPNSLSMSIGRFEYCSKDLQSKQQPPEGWVINRALRVYPLKYYTQSE